MLFGVSLWALHAQLQPAAILKNRNRGVFFFPFKLKVSAEKCWRSLTRHGELGLNELKVLEVAPN